MPRAAGLGACQGCPKGHRRRGLDVHRIPWPSPIDQRMWFTNPSTIVRSNKQVPPVSSMGFTGSANPTVARRDRDRQCHNAPTGPVPTDRSQGFHDDRCREQRPKRPRQTGDQPARGTLVLAYNQASPWSDSHRMAAAWPTAARRLRFGAKNACWIGDAVGRAATPTDAPLVLDPRCAQIKSAIVAFPMFSAPSVQRRWPRSLSLIIGGSSASTAET